MTRYAPTLLALLLTAPLLRAQDDGERIPAGEALDQATCQRLVEEMMPRIEAYTRLKYRRKVPVLVEPKTMWQARLKQEGFGGMTARSGLAFYNIIANNVTVVPWVIGGYLDGTPDLQTKRTWLDRLEPILLHEMTHAIHYQNFYVVLGGARMASLQASGQTEEQIDESTVEFLTSEGTAELVALRCATNPGYMDRHPNRELRSPNALMQRYVPDGNQPYRVKLSQFGYQDGMDIMHHLTLKAGPRGVRAVLYRRPPRVLFFQPDILAQVDLDDPPEPDSILGFLAPEILDGLELYRAVNPGDNRFFDTAADNVQAPGCLYGFHASCGSPDGPHGQGRYAFFVADPDSPGTWSKEQADSLKMLAPSGVKESTKPLPMAKGVQVKLLRVDAEDGSAYLRGEADGLVVLAHETKPTPTLEERVLLALRALYIKRPTPHLYDEAVKQARKRLGTG